MDGAPDLRRFTPSVFVSECRIKRLTQQTRSAILSNAIKDHFLCEFAALLVLLRTFFRKNPLQADQSAQTAMPQHPHHRKDLPGQHRRQHRNLHQKGTAEL